MTRDGKPVGSTEFGSGTLLFKLYAIGKRILNFICRASESRRGWFHQRGLTSASPPSSDVPVREPKGELDYFSHQSGRLANPGLLMAQTAQSVLNVSLALDFHLHVPRRWRGNARQEARECC